MTTSPVYQHILLTTDLSELSSGVANKAVQLAEALNTKLSIIHVVESNPTLYGLGEFALPIDLELEEILYKKAQENLEKEANRLNIPNQRRLLISGIKIDEIIEVTKQQQVDLILVGAHDKHGIELLFSSTADKLLHALPCDVTAIKIGE